MPVLVRAVGVALLACAFAAGCDDAPPPQSAGGSAAAAPITPSRESQLPENMVAAVSAGRSASMVSVHFALEAPPAVGKPLPVAIAVVPHDSFESVGAHFEAPSALILATGGTFEPQKGVKAETVLSHKLLLQPKKEGVFLVTAAIETEGAEGTVTRIYSIPVIVHGEAAPPQPAAEPAPAAEAPPAT